MVVEESQTGAAATKTFLEVPRVALKRESEDFVSVLGRASEGGMGMGRVRSGVGGGDIMPARARRIERAGPPPPSLPFSPRFLPHLHLS